MNTEQKVICMQLLTNSYQKLYLNISNGNIELVFECSIVIREAKNYLVVHTNDGMNAIIYWVEH